MSLPYERSSDASVPDPREIGFSRIEESVLPVRTPAAKEFLMTARILTALCLSLALAGANAQTTPPAPPAPKPAAGDEAKSAASDTPPDEKAYREAGKMADPEKKIAALEGIKKDFPDSRYVSAANWQIFNTLIQKMPDQKERIRSEEHTSELQ